MMNPPDRPPDRNQMPRPSVGRNLVSGPFLWIFLVLLAGVWLFSLFWQGVGQGSSIPVSYSLFTTQVNNDNVATAVIDNNNSTISGTFKTTVASDVTKKASGTPCGP